MKKKGFAVGIMVLTVLSPIIVLSEAIGVFIKGVNDGAKLAGKQDYNKIVILNGKVIVGKGQPEKSPKSLLNMATMEEIKGNKHYSEQRYDEGKVHYNEALQLCKNILKNFPPSDEAWKIETESGIEKLKIKLSGVVAWDGSFIAYDNGTEGHPHRSYVGFQGQRKGCNLAGGQGIL